MSMKWKLSFIQLVALSTMLFAGSVRADQLGPYTPHPGPIEKQVKVAARFKLQDHTPSKTITLEKLPTAEKEQLKHSNSSLRTKSLQIGVGRVVPATTGAVNSAALNWQALPSGGQAATMTVTSPEAVAIRLGLKIAKLPNGAELRFAGSANSAEVVGPITAQRAMRFPVYWTPMVFGDTVTVELYVPAGASTSDVEFSVSSVSHLVSSPVKLDNSALQEQSSSCSLEVDAVCLYGLPAVQTTANAVARMEFTEADGRSYLCTGTLLNSLTPNIPYFWGADHCISDNQVASSLITYWFYQSTACNSNIPSPNYATLFDGALLLYTNADDDGTMLLLGDAPPVGATYAAWDSGVIPPGSTIMGIHHPGGDLKKISVGTFTGYDTWNGVGSYNAVAWTKGITEGGSSGSGLFLINSNGDYALRGGLKGGTVSCTNQNGEDLYSRFDLAYPGVKQWLYSTTAPANLLYASISNITSTGATLGETADGATTAYMVVLPSTAPLPSTSQVLAGTDSFDAPAKSGHWVLLQPKVAATIKLTGLQSNTSYNVFTAAKDLNGGISNATYFTFTTLPGQATQTDVRTYVPNAAATGGYVSMVRVINTGSIASPITVARIDPRTGTVQNSGQLIASLGAGQSMTFSAQQVETAMNVALDAADRPRIRVGAVNTTIGVQSFLLQPGGVFNEVSPAQSGSTIIVPTYIPAAAAPSGYESFLRVINTGNATTSVTVARIDPATGLTGTPALLIGSLAPGAAMSFVGSQIEIALGLHLSASDRPQMAVTATSSTLDAQSFFIQPGGAFTDVSSSQSGTTVNVRTYVPAATAGYTSFLKIINNTATAAAVTATVIDGQTGVAGASAVLLPNLAGNAGVTLNSTDIEKAMNVSLPAANRPRISLTSSANLTVQSFLLQPGGAFNEVSGAQVGTSVTLATYVPAADAVSGYSSYIRIINTGSSTTPITVALIDPITGLTGTPATLIASLPAQAAWSFSPSQVEQALGIAITQGARPRIVIAGNGSNVLEVQSFLTQPGGVFTNVSGGQ
jgi:hypothetical protein